MLGCRYGVVFFGLGRVRELRDRLRGSTAGEFVAWLRNSVVGSRTRQRWAEQTTESRWSGPLSGFVWKLDDAGSFVWAHRASIRVSWTKSDGSDNCGK
jgi:hypothetical protein